MNKGQVAALLGRNAVKVFQFTDIVGGHPAILATDCVSVHSRHIVATEKAFQIEFHEILRLFCPREQ